MAETVADFLVERLMEWGVSRIYGYPGDGINGITAALRRGGYGCDFVQVRHEEAPSSQGRYWEMHDFLFDNQRHLEDMPEIRDWTWTEE